MTNHPLAQPDAYLWDRSGPADPVVRRLEALLGSARLDASAAPEFDVSARPLATIRPVRYALAAAAVIAVVFSIWYLTSSPRGPGSLPKPPTAALAWRIGPISGDAKVSEPVTGKFGPGVTARWFETGETSSVKASAAGQTVTISPGSSGVLIEGPGADDRSVRLESGSAGVIAGKAPAMVETSAGKSVAALRIRIEPDAEARIDLPEPGGKEPPAGQVSVVSGRADIRDADGRLLARVGEGMACPIGEQGRLGTPISAKPRREFADAVAALDSTTPENVKGRYLNFQQVLVQAKGLSEAATLWNLLLRAEPNERGSILKRLEGILIASGRGLPKADPESVVNLDQGALEAWWEAIAGSP